MTDVIDINAKRAPVVYTVTIVHHYDGTLEFKIDDVADDGRSREAVMQAFRRISGADEDLASEQYISKDLEEIFRDAKADNEVLQYRIEKLTKVLKPFADAAVDLDDDEYGHIWERGVAMNIDCDDLRAARDAYLGEKE